MSLFQALLLSLLQGASELFPVSSLGHAVVVPALLRWPNAAEVLDPAGPFLPFIVTLHLGTALALLLFYWRDWRRIVTAFFQQFTPRGGVATDAKVANLLVVGTVPAAVIALALEKKLRVLFASPTKAAVFLIVNGALMIAGELLRRRATAREGLAAPAPAAAPVPAGQPDHLPSDGLGLAHLTLVQAFLIGCAQALALVPGISRSGVTISAGLLSKLSHEAAARFSFLLATPIILLAGLHEVPKLRHPYQHLPHIGLYSAAGFVVSGVTAYVSVKFLTRYFETKRLDPFGYYCIALGIAVIAVARVGLITQVH